VECGGILALLFWSSAGRPGVTKRRTKMRKAVFEYRWALISILLSTSSAWADENRGEDRRSTECERRLFLVEREVCYFAPFDGVIDEWFVINEREEGDNFFTLDLIQSDGESEGVFSCNCQLRRPSAMLCVNGDFPETLIGTPNRNGEKIRGEDMLVDGRQFEFDATKIDCGEVPVP
jgi:hypothetical protein